MIGYDGKVERSTLFESAVAGGLSGAVTRLLLQPLDVVKIRFQLQVEPISHKYETSKYRGMYHAVRTIFRDEKLLAFWKGHNSAQLLSVIYGVAQFTVFEELSEILTIVSPQHSHGSWANFCCGGLATGVATVVSFPLDVIKTRFIAQADVKVYKSIPGALVTIFKNEGFCALFKGLTPTVIQSLPYGALQFGFYTSYSKGCSQLWEKLKTTSNLTVGFLSGMSSKVIVYPFDVCRKRLQIQGFQDARKSLGKEFVCSGMYDCFLLIYKKESWKGFFKGLQPAMIKSAFVTSVYFTIYDGVTGFMKN